MVSFAARSVALNLTFPERVTPSGGPEVQGCGLGWTRMSEMLIEPISIFIYIYVYLYMSYNIYIYIDR